MPETTEATVAFASVASGEASGAAYFMDERDRGCQTAGRPEGARPAIASA